MIALLALAGGVGAVTRFVVDAAVSRRVRRRIPLGTLVINVTGSLVLGILAGWVATGRGGGTADDLKAVLGTGFCGGYTTFSTAAVETVRLWLADGRRPGIGYASLTLVTCLAAAGLGLAVGHLL